MNAPLVERARAKVNLTLRVVGRRDDGYHEIESIVAFADVADTLTLSISDDLSVHVSGANAAACGEAANNLVFKAVGALRERIAELKLGRFTLDKQLPVAAGLGGGSADAAAALRLIAQANDLDLDDAHIIDAARATGADVLVCLKSQSCIMRGIGEQLSPLALLPLPVLLINPGVALATKDVFAAFRPSANAAPLKDNLRDGDALTALLRGAGNDLEAAAISLQPEIAKVIDELRALSGCQLARMSGSGATCFGLFASVEEAKAAAQSLRDRHPRWWLHAGRLGA